MPEKAVLTVSRVNYSKILNVTKIISEEHGEEVIDVIDFQAPFSRIRVSEGYTINIGDYQSARIDMSLEVPCYLEQANDAYTAARVFLEEKLKDILKDVRTLNRK